MGRPPVFVIVVDDDRPRVQPLLDALADVGGAVFDAPCRSEVAVLVASPSAAASSQVDQLLGAWAQGHPTGSVLVVLVGGDLHWDTSADSFDAVATTALPGPAQRLFSTRPLWLDARGGISAHVLTRMLAALAPEDEATCPQCGQVIKPTDEFCPNCGALLAWQRSTSEVSSVPPSPPASAHTPSTPPEPAAAGGLKPPAAPHRRTTRAWLLVALATASLVIVAVSLVLLIDPSEPDTAPGASVPTTVPTDVTVPTPGVPEEPSSGIPSWLLLVAGLAGGLAVGLAVTWRRRRSGVTTSTPPRRLPAVPAVTQGPPRPQPANPRATVFISHNFDTEHELALRLADDLRPDSDVWVAPESIGPGESWLTSVERGLVDSRVFLALLSKAALASPWVLKEIQAAMELEVQRNLRLVPIQVEDCEVPILLRTYQILRLAAGYHQIVEQTRRLTTAPVS